MIPLLPADVLTPATWVLIAAALWYVAVSYVLELLEVRRRRDTAREFRRAMAALYRSSRRRP